MLVIGADSGTQSTKVIILDPETGEVVASAQQAYGFLPGLPPGHLEQHPDTWAEALDLAVGECLEKTGPRRAEIAAIGVSGQQHGLVVLDKAGAPIRPAKLWCDTSTEAQCAAFRQEFGGDDELIRLGGNAILPGYTAPKLLWLKENEPGNFRRIQRVLLPHDYLNFWLTGETRMEYGDASGTGLLDIRTRQWCQPLVDFIDPELACWLPAPGSSREPAGLLRDSLREKWGLTGNVVVGAGGGDNMMGAIGTGNIRPGVVTASLGTSGTLYSFAEAPVIDAKGEVAAFCDSTDHWLPLVCTMNVTVATERVRALFGWDHAALEAAVTETPAGSDGVLFLPYLTGERTPNLPRATGVYHGLTTRNMTPGCLARAVMEGATLGLAYGLNRFRELGIEPAEIRLTGGGSQSSVWRQICADAFGVPTVCLESAEGAALGAAVQACAISEQVRGHSFQLADTVSRLVKTDARTRCQPDPDAVELYAARQTLQIELTRRLETAGYL